MNTGWTYYLSVIDFSTIEEYLGFIVVPAAQRPLKISSPQFFEQVKLIFISVVYPKTRQVKKIQ